MVDHRRVGVTGGEVDLALALLGVLGQRGGGAALVAGGPAALDRRVGAHRPVAAAHAIRLGQQRRRAAPHDGGRVAEQDLGGRPAGILGHAHGGQRRGSAQRGDDGVQAAVQDVHGDGVQVQLVALPQQRGAQLHRQGLQRAVAALGDGGVQDLGGRVEAGEHVDEDLPVAGGVGVDDAAGVGHGGGQWQLAEHVLAGIQRPDDVVGVQRGGRHTSTRSMVGSS
jgi:hypothetical protein